MINTPLSAIDGRNMLILKDSHLPDMVSNIQQGSQKSFKLTQIGAPWATGCGPTCHIIATEPVCFTS